MYQHPAHQETMSRKAVLCAPDSRNFWDTLYVRVWSNCSFAHGSFLLKVAMRLVCQWIEADRKSEISKLGHERYTGCPKIKISIKKL